jgi:signal transduction histidine kinase/ligand-binding sensor domain-containing protein
MVVHHDTEGRVADELEQLRQALAELKPELARALGTERFLREIRALRRRQVLSFSLLLLAGWVNLGGQGLPIKTYATVDGLAHNRVNRIVRDSRGFLWFCTAGGLSRFDGYAFANFGTEQGLPHSSVNDLLETRAGEYWVATDGGLVRFDPKGRPDARVVSENAAITPAPMFTVVVPDDADRQARAVIVLREGRDGTIWAGTNAGLYRLEHADGRRALRPVDVHMPNDFPEQRIIADVLEDARGSLWIAAPSGLYRRWPDGRAARYTTRDGLPSDYVQDLLEDHEGRLWAGTRLNGFFRFSADATHGTPVVDRKHSYAAQGRYGLPHPWVSQLFETSDRRFWVATAGGLAEFFPAGDDQHRFRSYSTRNGLSYSNITALNEDLGGNLWLGTNTAGAMKLTRGGFTTYGEQDGIREVHAVFEDRAGHLCFRGRVLGDARTSVFEGAKLDPLRGDQAVYHTRLGCFDGQRFDWFKPLESYSGWAWGWGWVNGHVTLQAKSGEWWVGTGRGLYRFPPSDHFMQLKTARPLAVYGTKDGLAAWQVFWLFEDSRGNVWVSTTSASTYGLALWEPLDGRLRDLAGAPGLPSLKDNLPRSFGDDRTGNVWIGFRSGLARYTQAGFTFLTVSEGLPSGAINDIHLDRSGRLWLASAGAGLVRVDNTSAERPAFVSYTTAQGLSSNISEVITEDLNGRLYVGGGRGLDQFDPATGRVKHFTTADGLAPGSFLAGFRDHSGVLWFGMTSGLARLAPTIEKPRAPPPVLITGLRVSGIAQPVSAVGEREMSLPDFTPDQNQLQIDFVGLGFGPGEVLRYQYRLEGADADWSGLGEQRTVTYARLASGRYRFVVRAMNSDGIVSDRPASIAFTILSPVWLRWWFLTLAALALGLMAYALYRYRVTRILEMANLRTRIATDLHDDIGANLTRIALLSEVAQRTHDVTRGSGADAPLASITRIARESVSSMSDIVWAINPKRESLLDLIRRMRQHADELFTLRGIQLRFTSPDTADSVRLGVDVRRDLLLIFKEAVNNAARHSRCSRVEIDLRVEGSRLVLAVVDDGVGFDASMESEGQGMTSMQRRAQRLKGTLAITSGAGVGTTVTLSIPK